MFADFWALNLRAKVFCLCFSFILSEELRRIAVKKGSILLLSWKNTNIWPLPAQLLSCHHRQSRVKLKMLFQREMKCENFYFTVCVVLFPRAKWKVAVYFSLVWPRWPSKQEINTRLGWVWCWIPLASVAEVLQAPASLSQPWFLVVQSFLGSNPVGLLGE